MEKPREFIDIYRIVSAFLSIFSPQFRPMRVRLSRGGEACVFRSVDRRSHPLTPNRRLHFLLLSSPGMLFSRAGFSPIRPETCTRQMRGNAPFDGFRTDPSIRGFAATQGEGNAAAAQGEENTIHLIPSRPAGPYRGFDPTVEGGSNGAMPARGSAPHAGVVESGILQERFANHPHWIPAYAGMRALGSELTDPPGNPPRNMR